jgi:hypothetical protein
MELEKNGEDQVDRSCEERNITWSQGGNDILRTINGRKANWARDILRRHCLIKHIERGRD